MGRIAPEGGTLRSLRVVLSEAIAPYRGEREDYHPLMADPTHKRQTCKKSSGRTNPKSVRSDQKFAGGLMSEIVIIAISIWTTEILWFFWASRADLWGM